MLLIMVDHVIDIVKGNHTNKPLQLLQYIVNCGILPMQARTRHVKQVFQRIDKIEAILKGLCSHVVHHVIDITIVASFL